MRENFVQSMTKQIEDKLHEESKFWRASKPLPNQSSVQGRELEEKSNTEEILHHLSPAAKFSQPPFSLEKIPHHLFHLRKFRITFFTCENFVSPFSLSKFSHLLFMLRNFRSFISHLRNPHVIFRYFAPTPLDFYLKIFCVIIYSLDSFLIGVSVDSCPHNGP